ncbi:hypothetical protein H8N03_22695 [Ramlibacter sp. USB13]|uniref:Uncharacterized protein n=1 Tax=Ramlibacter cellulosilyticus TaxID=2764187 RepID=A0A923MXZ7_9BURK|nr:hypothetical protein [Ramlibacter cellulosilyticus]MBC5785767.1 hypothetical protein [Ramlibacter cellulosilyticus]
MDPKQRAQGMTEQNHGERLAQAEERIALALRRIEAQEARMRTRRMTQQEQERAEALLRSMRETLDLFRMHRDSLVRLIEVRKIGRG